MGHLLTRLLMGFCPDVMKIYTKTGDQGYTSLYGGKRVPKNNLRIRAYGDIDELNSILGVCVAQGGSQNFPANTPLLKILTRLQHLLFNLGADLSAPPNLKLKSPRISKTNTVWIEKQIDFFEKKLPRLTTFILPGGTQLSAHLHHARAVCRRAEREIVGLIRSNSRSDSRSDSAGDSATKSAPHSAAPAINRHILPFLNRLSDLLFVLARFANLKHKVSDTKWKVHK